MFRYYSEDFLNKFVYSLSDIPKIYTANYEGLTMSMSFTEAKTVLGIDRAKTFSKCSKEFNKLCDDLGALKNTEVTYSLHANWVWFNFKGVFRGYADERAVQARAEHTAWRAKLSEESKQKQEAERISIKDGTYGLNNKDVGGVYLLSCGDYYKIGFSKNVKSRVSSIRGSNPVNVDLLVKYSPFDKEYRLLEGMLHEKFKDSRHQLEWFRKEFTEQDFIEACIEFCKEKAR